MCDVLWNWHVGQTLSRLLKSEKTNITRSIEENERTKHEQGIIQLVLESLRKSYTKYI